jgi:hypothetical protein
MINKSNMKSKVKALIILVALFFAGVFCLHILFKKNDQIVEKELFRTKIQLLDDYR